MLRPVPNHPAPAPRLAVAGIALALLGLGGCGGDDAAPQPDDRTRAVEALSAALAADADPGQEGLDPILDTSEVECQATALVDEVGVEQLVADGILDDDLATATLPKDSTPAAVKKANAAAISDCVGIVDYTLRLTRVVLATLAAQQGGQGYEVTDEQWADILACAEERLPEDRVRQRAVAHPEQPLLSRKQLARLAPCEPDVFGQQGGEQPPGE